MTYISSQSLAITLRQSILQAQTSLSQAQSEIATGLPSDLGITLGAQTGTALSLKAQIADLTALTGSNTVAASRLASTSSVLSSLMATAQTVSKSLIGASSSGGMTSILPSQAQDALRSLIASLNTSTGNQFIFGGINTGQIPVADYFSSSPSPAKQAVDSAFQQAFGTSQTSTAAGSISGQAMSNFLDTKFAALFTDGSWQPTWSKAASQTISSQISASQTTTTSVSANATAFRQITEAYTMLGEFTGSNLSADAKATVVGKASTLLSAGLAGLTSIQSTVGQTQSTIDTVNATMSAQTTLLKGNLSSLEEVDTYTLSTKVTQLQTQLEASYSLTSKLHGLSLLNYLTVG